MVGRYVLATACQVELASYSYTNGLLGIGYEAK